MSKLEETLHQSRKKFTVENGWGKNGAVYENVLQRGGQNLRASREHWGATAA